MSLIKSLNSAVSGLGVISENFGVISDNVSNVNNENYVRRTLVTEDDPQGGTRIASIRRETNELMQKSFRSALAKGESSEVRYQVYADLANVLGSSTGQSKLSEGVSSFVAGWLELQAAPENEAVVFKIEAAAQDIAEQIRFVATEVELMRQDINADIGQNIDDLNHYINRVDELNTLIITANKSSPARAGYENQRDEAIDDIAKLMDVSVQRNSDGTVSVYSKTGITLLSGFANQFTWDEQNQRIDSLLSSRNLVDELPDGSLRSRIQLVQDYDDKNAGSTEGSDPNISPLQKIEDQLDALVQLFVKPSSADNPTTFAGAFAALSDNPINYPGDHAPGSNPYATYWSKQAFVPSSKGVDDVTQVSAKNFHVGSEFATILHENAAKNEQISEVVKQLTQRSRSLDMNSLSIEDQNYEGIAKSIQVNFSVRNERVYSVRNANKASALKVTSNYRSSTGVSLDSEMSKITVLQNSYVATAKIITTVNNMFNALERVV